MDCLIVLELYLPRGEASDVMYTLLMMLCSLISVILQHSFSLTDGMVNHFSDTPDEQAYYQLSMKEKAGVMTPPKTPNTKLSIYMF